MGILNRRFLMGVFFCCLAQIQAHADAVLPGDWTLLIDSPRASATKVFLMGAKVGWVFQQNLVHQLVSRGVEVFYSVAPSLDGIDVAAGLGSQNVHLLPVDFETGVWAQDRFFRYSSATQQKTLFLPVMSDGLYAEDNVNATELALPQLWAQQDPQDFQSPATAASGVRPVSVDRGHGYPHIGETDPGFVQGQEWIWGYGDGGDRLETEHFLLIGRSTYDKMTPQFSTVAGNDPAAIQAAMSSFFGKKVIPVGEPLLSDQYLFHLDMFLTPVEDQNGQLTLLFGSASMALNEMMKTDLDHLPSWADRFTWQGKIQKEMKLKQQLTGMGIQIVDLPLFFISPEAFGTRGGLQAPIGFNNGIFVEHSFLCARYHSKIDSLNDLLAQAEAKVQEVHARVTGDDVVFIDGGETIASAGGAVRCMSAVMEQTTVSSAIKKH